MPVHFDSLRCHGAILTAAILQTEGRILRVDGSLCLPRLQDSSDAVKYDERCRARAQKVRGEKLQASLDHPLKWNALRFLRHPLASFPTVRMEWAEQARFGAEHRHSSCATMAAGLLATPQALRIVASSPWPSTGSVPISGQIIESVSKWHFAVAHCRCFYTLRATRTASSQNSGLEFRATGRLLGLAFLAATRSLPERTNMQPNSQERRTMRRFDMRLPAIVHVEK